MDNKSRYEAKEKKHNTAATSIECYKGLIKTDQLVSERTCTSRMLTPLTNLGCGNITRCLYDLMNTEKPKIKIAFKDKCKKINRTVKYYSTLNWRGNE
jgi:hypothetical protein